MFNDWWNWSSLFQIWLLFFSKLFHIWKPYFIFIKFNIFVLFKQKKLIQDVTSIFLQSIFIPRISRHHTWFVYLGLHVNWENLMKVIINFSNLIYCHIYIFDCFLHLIDMELILGSLILKLLEGLSLGQVQFLVSIMSISNFIHLLQQLFILLPYKIFHIIAVFSVLDSNILNKLFKIVNILPELILAYFIHISVIYHSYNLVFMDN